jgi:phage terminase large subunit-like protein
VKYFTFQERKLFFAEAPERMKRRWRCVITFNGIYFDSSAPLDIYDTHMINDGINILRRSCHLEICSARVSLFSAARESGMALVRKKRKREKRKRIIDEDYYVITLCHVNT